MAGSEGQDGHGKSIDLATLGVLNFDHIYLEIWQSVAVGVIYVIRNNIFNVLIANRGPNEDNLSL